MKNMFHQKNRVPAPAVSRACAILTLLGQNREPMGVSALARELGIGKSTVHGILQALLAAGAIEDTGNRQYGLGPLIEDLARSRRDRRGLAEICRPHLDELAGLTGQTSIFGIPENDRFRILVVAEGAGPLQVKIVPGGSIPLLAGAVGKIALAWEVVPFPESLPCFADDSSVDAEALSEEVKQVRKEALALDRGEYLKGVYAAASPILQGDRLLGVIFTAGFQDQIGNAGLVLLGREVARVAQAVARELL